MTIQFSKSRVLVIALCCVSRIFHCWSNILLGFVFDLVFKQMFWLERNLFVSFVDKSSVWCTVYYNPGIFIILRPSKSFSLVSSKHLLKNGACIPISYFWSWKMFLQKSTKAHKNFNYDHNLIQNCNCSAYYTIGKYKDRAMHRCYIMFLHNLFTRIFHLFNNILIGRNNFMNTLFHKSKSLARQWADIVRDLSMVNLFYYAE